MNKSIKQMKAIVDNVMTQREAFTQLKKKLKESFGMTFSIEKSGKEIWN